MEMEPQKVELEEDVDEEPSFAVQSAEKNGAIDSSNEILKSHHP